jgi:hypothetical protein
MGSSIRYRRWLVRAMMASVAAYGLLAQQEKAGNEDSAKSVVPGQSTEKEKEKKSPEPALKPTEARQYGTSDPSDVKPNLEPRIRPRPGAATGEEDPGDRRSNIRVDSTLVLIPVSVMDPMNRSVTGLEKEHFRVFEDKVEQEVAQFSSEDSPITVGVVFDASGSMARRWPSSSRRPTRKTSSS